MATSITARLSDTDVKAIDALVKAGVYSTRSDFLRAAARRHLREEAPEIPPLFLEAQRQAGTCGLTMNGALKAVRKTRRRLFSEMDRD